MSPSVELRLAPGEDKANVIATARIIAERWLARFEEAVSSPPPLQLEPLFLEDSWLKDSLALSWDLRTLMGLSKITQYVRERKEQDHRRLFNLKITARPQLQPNLKERGPMAWLESAFDFETDVGRGRGIVRLANTAVGEWKAWILFIGLEELNGHPRHINLRRQHFHQKPVPIPDEPNEETELTVVIIGAGHCGLSLAACLQDLNIRTLIIDRNQRVGDSWRKRYKSLKLHSPTWVDNMPYLDFPSIWPIFPDKDQVADFLEFYSRTLDLQVWLETELKSADYDDASGRWTVETVTTTTNSDHQKRRTLHPAHLVYAGSAHVLRHPEIPVWPGRDDFRGKLYHASEHTDASSVQGLQSKKVVVIGSNTTAHDISMDYVGAGADVTMVQRGSTIVLSISSVLHIAAPPPRDGLTSEDYVFENRSFPWNVLLGIVGHQTQVMAAHDAKLIEGLERTEFAVDKGETGDSFLARGLTRRGGFYINHGGSEAIADGRIRVLRSPEGIARLTPTGLVLADGRAVDADIIVLATSWKLFEHVIQHVMGEKIARRTTCAWGLDKEGEIGGDYRPTGHPGFWVAASNFGGSRVGAPLLALQIKAIEEGLNPRTQG